MPVLLFLHSQKRKHLFVFCFGKVDLVAQLVEQYTFNVWALGSSPSRITEIIRNSSVIGEFLFLCYPC